MKNFWKQLQKPFTVLAPMEDVTDVVFRQLIREIGPPDVFVTEFTSAEGMFSPGRNRVTQRLEKNEDEYPLVAQIWGKNPENYYKAAKEIVERGFHGVDINMGCPVKKIVKQGVCSALIDNEPLAHEIIQATIEGAAGKIPVSVKTRLGFSHKRTEEWSEFLLSHDIQALTMHGRIAKEMSTKPADWNEIRKVVEIKDELKKDVVIIGNGDIESLEEVVQKHEETGVDGVMIGRGVFKNPFVFNPDKSIEDLSISEKAQLMLRHVELFSEKWGSSKHFPILRRFLKIYINGFDNAGAVREELMKCEVYAEVKKVVDDFDLV